MKIVHGTWIPAETADFIQQGGFYLWVETDTPSHPSAAAAPARAASNAAVGTTRATVADAAATSITKTTARKRRAAGTPNPKQKLDLHLRSLTREALATFLDEALGIRDDGASVVAHDIESRYVLLPSGAGAGGVGEVSAPLPSFELLRYVDEELPTQVELRSWQVHCYRLRRPLLSLNDLHFAALRTEEEFQLGADLLFWHGYSQALRAVIARDDYIPALTYRSLSVEPAEPETTGKKATKGKGKKAARFEFELYHGWQFISDRYDATLRRYLAALPAACRAGAEARHPDGTGLYDGETLLRHFAECQLYATVTETPLTAKLDGQLAGTVLYDCMYPYKPALKSASPYAYSSVGPPRTREQQLDEYRQWADWRDRLARARTAAGAALCLRLVDALADDADNWQLRFMAASKQDPSLKLDLADYWRLDQQGRAEALRGMGQDARDFEATLLLALGYAARIYPKLWDGLETAQPVGLRLTLEEAFAFLRESAWVLEEAGYTVIVPSWWTPQGRRRARMRLKTTASTGSGSAAGPGRFSMETLVSYQYQLSIDGQPVTEEEWRQLVEAKTPLVQFRGEWMQLDRAHMEQMLRFWQERARDEPALTLLDLMRLDTELGDDLEWDHDAAMRDMMARLQDKSALVAVPDPPNLNGTLREYQRRGVAWLGYLESLGLNPCLADDMGLGKTATTIALLLNEKNRDGAVATEAVAPAPTLLIAPTSVLGNWRKEIERFAPDLRAVIHHGASRLTKEADFKAQARGCDVLITSFALARLDERLLRSVEWRRVVVDEAQNIKNPQSAQAKAIGKIQARHRVALTGTPVENRLRDLWSLFNFLNPGYLGKEAQFRKAFETPIQKDNDQERAATLKRLVEPFILRRLKTDKRIIDDLPDKVEQKVYCNLTPEQASLYQAVVKDVETQLYQAEGIGRKGLMLATLMRLKQICNHPAQFLQDGSPFTPERSHKLSRLAAMVEEVIEGGESLLIFTQFTEIGDALERFVAHTLHYNTYYLHGGTSMRRREEMVAQFQNPETEPTVFILSLRAGGTGITLTKANHVFHFDRWWNPAVEDQATDRAFRIGQRNNVFVHKFVAMGTMEERIDGLIEDKKRLSSAIVGGDESWLTELDNETFKELIALQRSAVME